METNHKYDVFISYSRKDYMYSDLKRPNPQSIVAKLLAELDKEKISYWIDKKGISGADEFGEVIVDAIIESRIFLFVSSEASNQSEWTLGEIATARDYKKTILPFKIDSSPFQKKIMIYLAPLSRIEYNPKDEKPFEELIESLNTKLDELNPNRLRIRQLREEHQKLLDDIKQKQGEIKTVAATLAELGEKVETPLQPDSEQVKKLQKTLQSKEADIVKLQAERAKLQDTISRLEEEKTQSDKNHKQQISQKDAEIKRLSAEIATLRQEKQRQAEAQRKAEEQKRKEEARRLAEAQKEKTFTVNGVSFKMIAVEGGTFQMGATPEQGSDADDDEKPVHKVTLSSYIIGQTQVTQELWQAVMGSNPSYWKGTKLPVEQVSYTDCQEFIQKLNQLTGQTFRLPTEAEWEFAARGGNLSNGYKYSGSNTIGDVAWYTENSSSKTHEVASKQPNELGLYDMSGNVWEWCADWYGSYSSSAQTDPTGPTSGSYRVRRGGRWYFTARGCRVSNRGTDSPSNRDYNLGLRLAM